MMGKQYREAVIAICFSIDASKERLRVLIPKPTFERLIGKTNSDRYTDLQFVIIAKLSEVFPLR